MLDVFYSISNKIIKFIFILFIILFSFSSIFTTNYLDFGNPEGYRVIYESGFNIVNVLLVVFLLVFTILANKNNFFNIKEKQLLLIESIAFMLCGICLIYMHNDVSLESDSRNVMDAAYALANGDYSVLDFKSYMNANPNNFGLFTIDYVLLKYLKRVSTVATVFRLVNLFFSIVLYVSLYEITDLLFNDHKTNMNLLLLFLGFNQLVFSSMFVYGNVISYSLAIVSIYFLLKYFKNKHVLNSIISIIAIMISVFVRRNSLIILIAEVILLVLYVIKSKKLMSLLLFPIIAVLLFVSTTGVERYYGNLVDYNYSDTSMPTITWIAYGLNYDKNTPGRWFDEYDKIHVANDFDNDLVKIEAKQFIDSVIKAFAKNPKLGISFFANKFTSSWSDPRYDSFTRSHNTLHPLLETDEFQNSLTYYWDAWLSFASIGLLILLIAKWEFKLEYMLPALCVIGGFLFHFFWEVKALYCYQYVLLLLPYVALGLSKSDKFINIM